MSREKILIVEDDEEIVELLRYNLTKNGYRVVAIPKGDGVIDLLYRESFDLIILDIMLPEKDGFTICREIKQRENISSIPIIMLTAKGEEADIVTGLELGADDYVVKPFSVKELIARIRSVLRNRKKINYNFEDREIEIGDIKIHPGKREVTVKDQKITLTNLEFMILYFLAKRPGWVFSRYQIVEGIRGNNYPVTDRSVDVIIVSLRKKLGAAGSYIETVRGAGYRLKVVE